MDHLDLQYTEYVLLNQSFLITHDDIAGQEIDQKLCEVCIICIKSHFFHLFKSVVRLIAMISARDLTRRIALSRPGYVVDKITAGFRGVATNFQLPDIDFKPEKYNGPSKSEVQALRKRYLNPGRYTWQLVT